MVKKALFSFLVLLTFPLFLGAGEFVANVSSTKVHTNDSFTLQLILKDTSTKEVPAISPLKKDFVIQSQEQLNNTTIVNGKFSSNITWKLTLVPKTEGAVTIPSITIDTAIGPLSTQPILLHVTKGSKNASSPDSDGPNLISSVSNGSPYKNEPLIYTAILTSKLPLYNIQTHKIQVEDAIVEFLEEPKLKEKAIEGVLFNIVEFTYLITPLKTGNLTIPPITIQGAVPQKRKGSSNSLFSDDFDPMAFVQGFDRLKSFTLSTEEMQLEVQPPIAEISPWLPAKALTLEEQWPSDQTLRIGEPFSRTILIKAEGVKAGQLPHLEDQQSQNSTFKVYADKPEEQEELSRGALFSKRKEQYTFIPQKAGTHVLPEISISWWDSVKKEKRITTLPARTLQILPAIETVSPYPQEPESASVTAAIAEPTPPPVPFLLYGIIGILTFLLTIALLWGFTLQRKIASLTTNSSAKPTKQPRIKPKPISPAKLFTQKEKKEKLPDLNPT